MKAYITCPICITNTRLPLLAEVENIAKKEKIEVFFFDISGSPEEVFEKDFFRLQSSQLLIAEVSEPSHGVGILIGLSFFLDLKRILLIEKGRKLSKIASGIPDTQLIEYDDTIDLKKKLTEALRTTKSSIGL